MWALYFLSWRNIACILFFMFVVAMVLTALTPKDMMDQWHEDHKRWAKQTEERDARNNAVSNSQ